MVIPGTFPDLGNLLVGFPDLHPIVLNQHLHFNFLNHDLVT